MLLKMVCLLPLGAMDKQQSRELNGWPVLFFVWFFWFLVLNVTIAEAHEMQYLYCSSIIQDGLFQGGRLPDFIFAFDGDSIYEVDGGSILRNDVQIPSIGGTVLSENHSTVSDTELDLTSTESFPQAAEPDFSVTFRISRIDLTYSMNTTYASGACKIIHPRSKAKKAKKAT